MAKQTHSVVKTVTLSIVLALRDIIWFPRLNEARPTGNYGTESESKKIHDSFVVDGWRQTGDGTVEVEAITDELRKEAEEVLTAKWVSLKEAALKDSNQLQAKTAWEMIHVVDGKLWIPNYTGLTGNRRASVVEGANVERLKANAPLIDAVPAIVKVFANSLERLIYQVQENSKKTEGFLQPSSLDNLVAALRMVERGASQADLRRAFKDGVGQKLWGVIALDKRWPDVGIIKRMRLDPTADGYIRLESVKFSDLPNLVLRGDEKELLKKNESLKNAGKDTMRAITQAEVEEYFGKVGKDEGNAPKIMKKDNIASLSVNSPNPDVQAAAKAILENNQDGLKEANLVAPAAAAVRKMAKDGDYPAVEFILVSLAEMKDRAGMLTKIADLFGK